MFEQYKAFNAELLAAVPSFLSKEYFKTVEVVVSESYGAQLSNFLSFPAFKRLMAVAFSTPIRDASEHLAKASRDYVQRTFVVLLDKEARAGIKRICCPSPSLTRSPGSMRDQNSSARLKTCATSCEPSWNRFWMTRRRRSSRL